MPQTPEFILHRAQLSGDIKTFQGKYQDQGDLGRVNILQKSHPATALKDSLLQAQSHRPSLFLMQMSDRRGDGR